jgi:hypothetical protein
MARSTSILESGQALPTSPPAEQSLERIEERRRTGMPERSNRYDETVVPRLKEIRSAVRIIKYYTAKMARAAEGIEFLPEWLTRAEADLEEAALEIHRARDLLEEKTREKV